MSGLHNHLLAVTERQGPRFRQVERTPRLPAPPLPDPDDVDRPPYAFAVRIRRTATLPPVRPYPVATVEVIDVRCPWCARLHPVRRGDERVALGLPLPAWCGPREYVVHVPAGTPVLAELEDAAE